MNKLFFRRFKFSRLFMLIILVFFISLSACLAAESLPKPDKNGDYIGKMSHKSWVVTDSGFLNGRLSHELPMYWYDPRVKWPRMNIGQWPVIRKFAGGTILTANGVPAGFVVIHDENEKPWLKVNISPPGEKSGDAVCYVRANVKYVRPIQTNRTPDLSFSMGLIDDPDGYTNVRARPSKENSIICRVNRGEHFLMLSRGGDWWKILAPTGKQGYMHKSRIRTVVDGFTGAARVSDPDGYLNIREGPSTSYKVVGKAQNQEVLYLLPAPWDIKHKDPIGPWIRVMTVNGQIGYVSSTRLIWITL